MDFNNPIDITAVLNAVKKHKDVLKAIDKLDAHEVLQHFTPLAGITDSIELGKVEGGSVSSKYTGEFKAGKNMGKVVPRRLVVRPVVMEMKDEPERYRRTYLAEVPGEIRKEHPFELWIINFGHALASNDLLMAMFSARYDVSGAKTDITDAFDGVGTIIEDGKAVGDISSIEGNVFTTGDLTLANIGDQLLKMYRSMPTTFRRKKNQKLFMSDDLADLYDDWRKNEGHVVIGQLEETAGTKYLVGSSGKCEIVRLPNLPANSKFVLLTTKENVCYGFDKEADFKSIRPFASGNPYLFTAAGKYVIGFQFVSVHKDEFRINDQPLDPAGTNEFGYIDVTISTPEAIANGAAWRIKGETEWRASGTYAAVPAGKAYDIEFAPAAGYQTPVAVQKTPAKGATEKVTQAYSPAV